MAWLESIRFDVIPIWLLVWIGWLLVTGSIGELWRAMLSRQTPILARLAMPFVIAGLAFAATFVSIQLVHPLGEWLGFGKATWYWMLVVLFLAPFDIWPAVWFDEPRGDWRISLRNIGLKLGLPLVVSLAGLSVLWLYAWATAGIARLLMKMNSWLAAGFENWFVLQKEFDADQLSFDQPWLLVLIVGIPVLFIISYRSLAALGKYRRMFSLGYRGRVLLLMILALAGVQLQKISERMTVMYLLDQSESIPKPVREAMLQYVMQDVELHRRKGDLQSGTEDKAGVIVFGREATIEHPPFADDIRSVGNIDSLFELRTDATNIASALKLAQAAFPEDSAKRIVVITDGNENLGDARSVASGLADNGIGIDVVAVRLAARNEIAVEKIGLPSDIRRGQPLEARIVLHNYGTEEVKGLLRIIQNFNGQDNLLQESDVTLKPGKNVFSVQHTIDLPAGYTYTARFIPEKGSGDAMDQNNTATAFTHVRGKGRVLLIVDAENPREFDGLIQRLGELNMEVDPMPSDNLFTSLAQLQGYDCVVLANLARSATGGEDAVAFTDDQIAMLVRNTEQFGCGLVMIGGPNSYGAGGWANTDLEKAMPVDFQIKNSKVKAVGALVLLMHACEIPDGNNIQKKVAEESVKVLGPMDYCGLLQWENFTGGDNWLWFDSKKKGLTRVGDQQKSMIARIGRMAPGDMPDFEPAMTKAIKEFETNPASVKHMIVISDGDPSPPSNAIMTRFKNANVTVSTVAIGSHGPAESGLLQRIANQTGGKYYAVNNPKAIPKIFQRESRRVARPLILEDKLQPYILPEARGHEMLQNIDGDLPQLTGFVMTTVKENPLVEVLIRSPKPGEDSNSTILAAWTYGAGKTCVFTSDAGQRWANQWTEWENYNKFYSQMIRWAMRPVNEEGKFTVATEVKDGKVRVVVTALKDNDEFLNFLNMSGVGADPELKNVQLNMLQEAPGRYVGEFDADKAGSYLLAINTGLGGAPLLTGITVPYSAEYRERESNDAILTSLASYVPKGGEKGALVEGPLEKESVPQLIKNHDSFRRTLAKANSSQDIWPIYLMLAGVIFLADVFVRRVQVNFDWVLPSLMWTWHWILRREGPVAADERMDRLRNLKATVSNQLDERRAAARFEPQVDADAPPARDPNEVLGEAAAGGGAAPPPPPRSTGPLPQTESESYTERLLKAKKKSKQDPS